MGNSSKNPMQCYGFSTLHCVLLQKNQVKPLAINALKSIKWGIIWKNDKKCSIKSIKGGIIWNLNNVELWFVYTALRVIARNMHTKFGVIWTYGDKVKLQTKNAQWKTIKGEQFKLEQCRVKVLVHCTSSYYQKHA